jgi:hypothetical protein
VYLQKCKIVGDVRIATSSKLVIDSSSLTGRLVIEQGGELVIKNHSKVLSLIHRGGQLRYETNNLTDSRLELADFGLLNSSVVITVRGTSLKLGDNVVIKGKVSSRGMPKLKVLGSLSEMDYRLKMGSLMVVAKRKANKMTNHGQSNSCVKAKAERIKKCSCHRVFYCPTMPRCYPCFDVRQISKACHLARMTYTPLPNKTATKPRP